VILGGGVFALAALALWIYCIIDVVTTDEGAVRNLPKGMWLIIVIFVPTVGSIVWLVAGRPQDRGFAIGGEGPRPDARLRGQGDWLDRDDIDPLVREREERARLRMWEEQLRRREEELRRREGGVDDQPPAP
jgi:hypothetical protein